MPSWQIVLIVIALIVAPFLLLRLHRWLLCLEERGHIYYLHKKPQGGAMSSLSVLHEAIDPGMKYVHEARQVTAKQATQRDLIKAKLLSLLQADTIDDTAIQSLLATCGDDASSIYAE